MTDRIWLATRKGLICVERSRKKAPYWEVGPAAFLGDSVTMVLPDPRDGSIYAGLRLGHFGPKLRRSRDGGANWEECAAPAFPAAKDEAKEKAPSVDQLWSLEAGGPAGTLWAGAIPAGLFRSRDHGASWELISSLWDRPERKEWFGGGYDHPGIHSICVDPRDPRRVTVAISCGGVWRSNDDGATWEPRTRGMRAAYMPPERAEDPNIQDPHHVVACPAQPDVFWTQHHNGIFRSVDGASRWQEITNVQPSAFGFAVAVHPAHADTAWFVPAVKDESRVPVDNRLVVTRTRDGGKTFETLRDGLPQERSYDLVYRHGLDVDRTGTRLVMGSTTGNLWISEDQGESWQQVAGYLPPIYCARFS